MNSSKGAPVYTGAALGFSFCCGRGEVARKTKELYFAKVFSNAVYMPGKSFNLLYQLSRLLVRCRTYSTNSISPGRQVCSNHASVGL